MTSNFKVISIVHSIQAKSYDFLYTLTIQTLYRFRKICSKSKHCYYQGQKLKTKSWRRGLWKRRTFHCSEKSWSLKLSGNDQKVTDGVFIFSVVFGSGKFVSNKAIFCIWQSIWSDFRPPSCLSTSRYEKLLSEYRFYRLFYQKWLKWILILPLVHISIPLLISSFLGKSWKL